jgi:hypothetical protein
MPVDNSTCCYTHARATMKLHESRFFAQKYTKNKLVEDDRQPADDYFNYSSRLEN